MLPFDTSKLKIELYAKELELEQQHKEMKFAYLHLQSKAARSEVNLKGTTGYKGLIPLPRCPKCNSKKIGHTKHCQECGHTY